MSRIAKDPVNIPSGVQVASEGNNISFKGPKGELSLQVHPDVKFDISENSIQVKWERDEDRAMAGTCLLYTSPSPRDRQKSRMPSSA